MKNNKLVVSVGATTLITLGALGLSLTGESKEKLNPEDSIFYESDFAIRNTYQELVWQATDKVEYENVREIARITAEKRVEEEERQHKLIEEMERQKKLKEEEEKNNLGIFNVSWYTSSCGGCSGVTAKGVDVRNTTKYKGFQVAATDWSIIPPYSIIEVEGYGQFIVIDKGGAIKGKKLDLLVATKNEAYKNGRQYLNVKVIRWGDENE